MKNRIWVVEMYNEARKRWEPCSGLGFTKQEALDIKRDYQVNNPNDKFRVTPYAPVEKAK